MKNLFRFCVRAIPLAAAAALAAGGPPAQTAPPKKPGPAAPTTKTNAASSEVQIPQSVFIIPTSPKEGLDPFFPNSNRLFTPKKVKTTPSGVETLVFNGLSGSPAKRYAMINGHTLAEGEEAEVNTPEGRARIRCLQIKAESVVIEMDGQRRELHMRQNY
jgi:hypothetical protein